MKSEDDTGIHSGSSETDHEVSGVQVWGGVGRDIVSMFRRETCCSYFCIGHILSPSGMTGLVYKLEIFFFTYLHHLKILIRYREQEL